MRLVFVIIIHQKIGGIPCFMTYPHNDLMLPQYLIIITSDLVSVF